MIGMKAYKILSKGNGWWPEEVEIGDIVYEKFTKTYSINKDGSPPLYGLPDNCLEATE